MPLKVHRHPLVTPRKTWGVNPKSSMVSWPDPSFQRGWLARLFLPWGSPYGSSHWI